MLAFNLLPHSFKLPARRQRKKRIIIFCALSVVIIILLIMITHHPAKKSVNTRPVPAVYTPTFQWIGYLQQGSRFWALLQLANHKVIVVQQGSVIEQARIVKLNEQSLVLEKNHQRYTLQRKHHD